MLWNVRKSHFPDIDDARYLTEYTHDTIKGIFRKNFYILSRFAYTVDEFIELFCFKYDL